MRHLLFLGLAFMVLLASCGPAEQKPSNPFEQYLYDAGFKKWDKTESGIYYVVEKEGNGSHPTINDKVTVHYEGTLLDGTKFDSSYDRKKPATFPLKNVVKGWQEGIPLFSEGGKGILVIPTNLGYGQNPRPGGVIKPGDDLVFKVELIKIE